jgi:4-amino-4-deoxy-L-arabinose transferase-like glycosyltransferase
MATRQIGLLRQAARRTWAHGLDTAITVALLVLAGALRFTAIDARSINNDEAFTLWLVRHSPGYIVQYTTFGGLDANTPPLHYLVLRALASLSDDPIAARLPSAVAGILSVWLTFRLARVLFDKGVATLGALLMAVAPLHVTLSQIGRGHTLAGLLALLSLYCFARLVFGKPGKWDWVGIVAAGALAVWTFYTTALVIVYENVWMTLLALRGRLSRPLLLRWLTAQLVLALLILPAAISALISASASPGWMGRPGLAALVKTAILFGTGDPSYGPTGITPARVLALLVLTATLALGLWLLFGRNPEQRLAEERPRALFLLGAVAVPWALLFVVSQVYPVYTERYLIFVLSALLILMAWILLRTRPVIAALALGLSLIALTGSALVVYYTEPNGEQWREIVLYLRSSFQPSDLVIVSPGHYSRPFAYYLVGGMGPEQATIQYEPALVLEDGTFRALQPTAQSATDPIVDPALRGARRIWLATGYSAPDPRVVRWLGENCQEVQGRELVGASAHLWHCAGSAAEP